jgi:histidyl-tRNA synthetase
MGLERVILAMPERPAPRRPHCFVAPMGPRATREALVLARDVRALGHTAEVDGRGGSLKSMLRRADSKGATLCVVLGDAELDQGVVQVKHLVQHHQETLPRAEAGARIVRLLLEAESQEPGAP